MDYGKMVGDAFAYAKDGVWEKWNKWLMLVIATILLGIPLTGYVMKVLRGEKTAPEVTDWGTLFVDGIKALIVMLIYSIPIIIVEMLMMGGMVAGAMSGDPTVMMAAIGAMLVGFVVVVILAIIIALFALIGIVRLARTGSIGEALNFKAILATIGKIGWIPYIIALIVYMIVTVIFGIVMAILMMIPILGWIIYLCLIAPFAIFAGRYFCQIYDSAGA